MNKTKERILSLQEILKEKRSNLQNNTKFSMITDNKLKLDGCDYDLDNVSERTLTFLLVKLSLYKNQASELGILEDFRINEYKVESWISDINYKLHILKSKRNMPSIQHMENILDLLLSNEKKEAQLDEIEEMLINM